MDCSTAPLLEDAHAFLVMRNLYAAAGRQLTLKFEVLNSEFNVLYARNPIHHIESRVKSPESIAAKLLKKGLPLTLESAMQNVNDIAGVRVVCSYIDDVYRVAEMVERPAGSGDRQAAGLYQNAELQWLPLPASGPARAGLPFEPDRAGAGGGSDPYHRHGLLGQSGARYPLQG